MPPIDLEFKDWLLIIGFISSLAAGWAKLKGRIDRVGEVHSEIKQTLAVLTDDGKKRHHEIHETLVTIGTHVGKFNTSIAVLNTNHKNMSERIDRLASN